MPVTDQAFVTLCTNDIYCQGALVLGQSLRNHETSRKLVVIITAQVSSRMRTTLGKVFDEVLEVEVLDSADLVRLTLLGRPELGVTFTKIQCWTLTQYTKCVYMDADTIALRNIDELFDREEFSAAPDSGWPDCFNSGVFVFRPSLETFRRLLQYAEDHGSFDGGDQGLLNGFFSDWATADISKHLPFIYNLSICSVYTYIPAFKQFGSEAKVVHFIGTPKPWNCKYNPQTKCIVQEESLSGDQHLLFLVHWWEIYISDILPLLEQEGLDCSTDTHHFGRIELQMKCEKPSDCSKEAHSDDAGDAIWKSCSEEARTVASDCYETSTAASDQTNNDSAVIWKSCSEEARTVGSDCYETSTAASDQTNNDSVQPSSSSEQPALDDSLPGQDLLPAQLSPEPVTQEDSDHMIWKSCSEEARTVGSDCYETSTAASDQTNNDSAVQPSSSSEQPALDDSLPGQDLLPAQLSPEPVTQEDSDHMPHLSKSVSELAIQEAEAQRAEEEERRKWEEGHIDYMGKHAFENIQKKLDRFLQ